MHSKIVTVVGGTGFVGRYVVKMLAAAGYTIRVIARNPDAAGHLKTAGEVGQIVLVRGNLAKPESLQGKLDNSWAVINLVGILFETTSQNFSALHAKGAEKLAQLAKTAGAERFIHMSSIGVDKAVKSKYARTKAMGEKAVQAAFPGATILRPSIVFGAEDQFFNKFAALATIAPALPLIGGGHTKFQPVYVGDVAKAVEHCLAQPNTCGGTYELGGPEVFTFRQLLEYVRTTTGRSPFLVNIPFGVASFAGYFTQLMPRPLLTHDQVALLEHDNVVAKDAKTFADLHITPTAVESIVPEYLSRYRKPEFSHYGDLAQPE
jgi:NADH dehydrogenase